jgi:hypothetical protein
MIPTEEQSLLGEGELESYLVLRRPCGLDEDA